ncbi:MAG: hypothetical protein ABII09_02765 [Planctomycetota bacterium]
MKSAKILFVVIAAGIISGCAPETTRLTVDFRKEQTLKYRFVSSRDITMDWGPAKQGGENKIDKFFESLEMVVVYTPVEVDPYGLATIKADCVSAKVNRTGGRQARRADAAESLAGKSWAFTVGPTGKMEDRSELLGVIRQAGKLAFRSDTSQGLIKEPDMLYDFIASQWFLWDSISSIPDPLRGVAVGETWKSKLFVPAPTILFAARDVTYQLEAIRGPNEPAEDPNSRIAVINSSYSLLYPSPSDWPVPYTEVFQMSGMFGFLSSYKVLDLQGHGLELFNIDAGRTEQDIQKYTVHVQASLPFGLGGIRPEITIDQTLTMEPLASPNNAKGR